MTSVGAGRSIGASVNSPKRSPQTERGNVGRRDVEPEDELDAKAIGARVADKSNQLLSSSRPLGSRRGGDSGLPSRSPRRARLFQVAQRRFSFRRALRSPAPA